MRGPMPRTDHRSPALRILDRMGAFVDWIRANTSPRVRRLVIGAVGGSMALAGLLLLVLPGPGIPLILAGLGVLSLEFAIARTWILAVQRRADRAGVPRSALWVLPLAGILLSIVAGLAPGFTGIVVDDARAWHVVRKPAFGFDYAYVTLEELRLAAQADPFARAMLDRTEGIVHTTHDPH
jgi:hypothetical protein